MEPENQLYLTLGRVEGKLDQALQRADKQDKRTDEIERVQSLHSERIGALEHDRRWIVGVATALSVPLGWFVSYLKDYFLKWARKPRRRSLSSSTKRSPRTSSTASGPAPPRRPTSTLPAPS